MATRRRYDLYYTLNTNIPPRGFTTEETGIFRTNIGKLDQLQSQAVVLLIYEHSLIAEELTSLPDLLTLPYGGIQKRISVSFDFDLLPSNLKWILFKFFGVLNIPTNE